MDRLLRMREAAATLGVHVQTIRNWDEVGKIRTIRSPGGQRKIPHSEIERMMGELERREVKLYARVSTFAQEGDLERQIQRLKQSYPNAELFSDYRSGLKFDRKGFLALLEAVQQCRVSKVVVVYEDCSPLTVRNWKFLILWNYRRPNRNLLRTSWPSSHHFQHVSMDFVRTRRRRRSKKPERC